MKLILGLLLSVSINAFAWDNPDIDGRRDTESSYKSRFGNEYEYDLSRPVDRIKYETDYDAQRRDSLNIDPMQEIERDLGQRGGGAKRRK